MISAVYLSYVIWEAHTCATCDHPFTVPHFTTLRSTLLKRATNPEHLPDTHPCLTQALQFSVLLCCVLVMCVRALSTILVCTM